MRITGISKSKAMSQVSKELILELQTIIKEESGKEVTFEEASKIANGLVGYFDTLAKIHHKNEEKKETAKS